MTTRFAGFVMNFSVLIFLGIPMATILCVNIILFIATAYGIHRSKKTSQKVLKDSKGKNIMESLIIYAKVDIFINFLLIFLTLIVLCLLIEY